MVLNEWTTGDTITEIAANNRGIRKGTESEIAAIPTASNEEGDYFFNSTEGLPQVQTGGGATDKRANLALGYDADATEVTVVGITPTQVKDTSYIKNAAGIKGNQITIIAEIKTSNAGTTAHLRVRTDLGGSDDLDLTTTSTSFVIVTGVIDITGKADGRLTVEIFMDDGVGDTVTNRELEVLYI